MNCSIYPVQSLLGYNVSMHVANDSVCGYANYHVAMAFGCGVIALGVMLLQIFLSCCNVKTDLIILILFLCLACGFEGVVPFTFYVCWCRDDQADDTNEETSSRSSSCSVAVENARVAPDVEVVGGPGSSSNVPPAIVVVTEKMIRHGRIPIRPNTSWFLPNKRHSTN